MAWKPKATPTLNGEAAAKFMEIVQTSGAQKVQLEKKIEIKNTIEAVLKNCKF